MPNIFFLPLIDEGQYEQHKPLGIRLSTLNIGFHKLLSHFDVCWLFLLFPPDSKSGKLEREKPFSPLGQDAAQP